MTELSYIEMLTEAQKVDPTATIKSINGVWYVLIPTPWVESAVLDDSLKGTPAEEALNKPEENHGTALHHWAAMNGLKNVSLHVIAVHYNLTVARSKNMDDYIAAKAEEAGVVIPTDFDELMKLGMTDEWAVIAGWYEEAAEYASAIYREALLEATEKYRIWLNG